MSSLELCPGSAQVLNQTISGTEFEPVCYLPAVLGGQFGQAGFCSLRLVGLTPSIQVNFFIKMFLENIPCAQRKVCSSRRGFFLQRARHASSCGQKAIASGTCENRSLFIKKKVFIFTPSKPLLRSLFKVQLDRKCLLQNQTEDFNRCTLAKKRVQTQQGIQKGQTVIYGHGKGISNKCLWLGAGVFVLPVMSLWVWGLAYSSLFS